MWPARARSVTGFEPASGLGPTGARREWPQENETRRCGKTKPNPPRPARHRHLPVQVPEFRTRAPRRHPCSPPPPGHCSAKRIPDPCLPPTSVVTAPRIDRGVRRGLHLGSSRVGSPQYLAQVRAAFSLRTRSHPWGDCSPGAHEQALLWGGGRGRAGAELQVRGRKSRAPGAGPSAGAQDRVLGRGGRRHGGPGDPGPSPDAAQLLPSLNQRSGARGQQPASRERSWDKPGVPETKPGASRSGRAGDGRVGGAAAALFGFLTSDSSSGNNIQILSRLKYFVGMEKHRPPGRNGSDGGGECGSLA